MENVRADSSRGFSGMATSHVSSLGRRKFVPSDSTENRSKRGREASNFGSGPNIGSDVKPCGNAVKSNGNNRYAGSEISKIEHISVASISPREFFEVYVRVRKPVIIKLETETSANGVDAKYNTKQPDSQSTRTWWAGFSKWKSNDYLRQKAGSGNVRVEVFRPNGTAFGHGAHEMMTFGKFLDHLDRGSSKYYLTTQDVATDEEGRPDLMSTPCTELREDFPLIPPLAGNLLPMNVNIWMGKSQSGSAGTSSGLHHDYHDNFYFLLRGRKRFRIFSPADAHLLYTHGKIAMVHENGRICYVGAETHADGSTEEARQAMKADTEMDAASKELEAAEEAVMRGEEGAQERLRIAEANLDKCMDKTMQFGPGEDFDEEEPVLDSDASTKKDEQLTPNHFSKIDMSLPCEERERIWPGLKSTKMVEFEVMPGEILYLPAGWFHEVTSISGNSHGKSCPANQGHMAFNYWFHPPDTPSFEQPYSSSFWLWDWEKRQ